MSASAQFETDRGDGSNIDGVSSGQQPSFAARLRNTLNTIPEYTWYAVPSGGLAFIRTEWTVDWIKRSKIADRRYLYEDSAAVVGVRLQNGIAFVFDRIPQRGQGLLLACGFSVRSTGGTGWFASGAREESV